MKSTTIGALEWQEIDRSDTSPPPDYSSGYDDGFKGSTPWLWSTKSSGYKMGFRAGWRAGQNGPMPVIGEGYAIGLDVLGAGYDALGAIYDPTKAYKAGETAIFTSGNELAATRDLAPGDLSLGAWVAAWPHGTMILGAGKPARHMKPRPRSYAPHDEVRSPSKVTVSPRGVGSTVYTSGIARVAVTGGYFWVPDFAPTHKIWDDSSGPLTAPHSGTPPTVVIYFQNGASKVFKGLESVDVENGSMQRGMTSVVGTDAASGGADTIRAYTDADTVRAVQQFLNGIGGGKAFSLKVDGTLGPQTNAAVKKFNTDYRNTPADREFITDGTLASMAIKSSATPAEVILKPATPATSGGRPAQGWSQPQPGAMGPAITPTSSDQGFLAKLKSVAETEVVGGVPAWQIALAALGTLGIGYGVYRVVR